MSSDPTGSPPPRRHDQEDPAPFEPFALEGSESLVVSPWCALRRDSVRVDEGDLRSYYIFELPPAAVVVPVLPDGSIVTLWQYRYPLGRTHWEIPAGRIDEGEEPLEAAARELTEETGYRADRFSPLPGFFPINGISPHRAHAFVAHDCILEGEPTPDPTERISVHVMEEREVRRRLIRGDFRDAFTALALFHHFACLDRG